ncbi:hypothetical protein J6590_096245 [Homalodisca vitripennis]|nr:hypothetical protein J6590_096245 [Homalodisca vitripennis]
MADQINEYGANISPRSVRRLLNTEGLNARRSRKKRKITSTMAKKRLEWVKGLDHWTTDYWEKKTSEDNSKNIISAHCTVHVPRDLFASITTVRSSSIIPFYL